MQNFIRRTLSASSRLLLLTVTFGIYSRKWSCMHTQLFWFHLTPLLYLPALHLVKLNFLILRYWKAILLFPIPFKRKSLWILFNFFTNESHDEIMAFLPQNLTDQLAVYTHNITTCPPPPHQDFYTFRRHWVKNGKSNQSHKNHTHLWFRPGRTYGDGWDSI